MSHVLVIESAGNAVHVATLHVVVVVALPYWIGTNPDGPAEAIDTIIPVGPYAALTIGCACDTKIGCCIGDANAPLAEPMPVATNAYGGCANAIAVPR